MSNSLREETDLKLWKRFLRFITKVEITDTCWLWKAATAREGYGSFDKGYAHRVSYEYFVGLIPKGKDLDHLCRVRNCVNPHHLEPVTRRENLLRGRGWAWWQRQKTHCPKGHPYDETNTFLDYRGFRCCHICLKAKWKIQNKAYYNKRKQAAAADRLLLEGDE